MNFKKNVESYRVPKEKAQCTESSGNLYSDAYQSFSSKFLSLEYSILTIVFDG